jgi:hypothetical protein
LLISSEYTIELLLGNSHEPSHLAVPVPPLSLLLSAELPISDKKEVGWHAKQYLVVTEVRAFRQFGDVESVEEVGHQNGASLDKAEAVYLLAW